MWHAPGGTTAKVIVTGTGDGGFVSRVVIVSASGECPVAKAHRLDPVADPDAVWDEVETILSAINGAPMGWGRTIRSSPPTWTSPRWTPRSRAAEADARAAGLLAAERVH